MGSSNSIVRIIFGRILPFLIVVVAVFVGWLMTSPMSYGYIFATISPILEGRLPPCIIGHGHMVGTQPVPDDMKPRPRPQNELFHTLPGTGDKMPMSGIGMCCRYSAYDDVLVRRTVLWFLLLGGRHIDGAHVYMNHMAIGLGIQDAIERGIPREEIFFTTKIFPPYFGYKTTLGTVPKFLEETGLDYIDMVLMHAPKMPLSRNECVKAGISDTQCRQDTWRALSELRDKGIMRNIGVSNFGIDHMKEIKELNLAPISNNQFNWNVFVPQKQHDVFNYCIENNIAVTGYYSLGGSMQRSQASAVELLQELATKHGASTYGLMLRWSIQKGAGVIPGMGNPDHMKSNLDIYSFDVSKQDMGALDALKSDEKLTSKFIFFDPDMFASKKKKT